METATGSECLIENDNTNVALDNFCSPENSVYYNSNSYANLYRTREEIRLLEILQAEDGIPINANLITTSLEPLESEPREYFAISYFAGNYTDTEVMYVNGIRFNAFANLGRAIRQLAQVRDSIGFQFCPLLVWADQICINQSDSAERSHQVGFMRKIYEYARLVIACLGENPNGDGRWIKAATSLKPLTSLEFDFDDARILVDGRLFADFRDVDFQQDWTALTVLLRNPWWQRGWVYQEVALAQELLLIFGHRSLNWETLQDAFRVVQHVQQVYARQILSGQVEHHPNGIGGLILSEFNIRYAVFMINGRRYWHEFGGKSLIKLLVDAQVCKVTDIKDRIFAFIGLANPGYGIVPDYSVDVSTIFQSVCRHIIIYERSFDVLTCCTVNDGEFPRREGISSWTLDWSLTDASFEFLYDPVQDSPPFRACSNHLKAASFNPLEESPDHILKVQCLFIDDVAVENSLGPRCNGNMQIVEDWMAIAGFTDIDLEKKYQFGEAISISEALAEVILRGKKRSDLGSANSNADVER